MNVKTTFMTISLTLLALMGIFFLTNPSYQKSLEAKYYYEMGDFDRSYALAKEAFSQDLYNRMAATIMAQSLTSMKYQKYIDQAKEYLIQIKDIATNKQVDDAQRAKIKVMSQIMTNRYIKLAPSVVTDADLVEKAAKYHAKFEKILETVDR
ncbi:MAG: hypothetical protein FAF05_02785 [Epsilonproteobacteria bacterium]|nr:hypothetical protein [Campylobacterota bacterium]